MRSCNNRSSGCKLELANLERKTHRLQDALQALLGMMPDAERYSYVLVDCPPSLNLLTINALVSADAVLVPLQCEFFALEGLSQLMKTVERVRASLNSRLIIQGVVLTMYDRRNSLSEQVAQDVREVLGEKVYQTVIPRNVRISEAPSHGRPVLLYDHTCVGSQAYIKLASEVIRRERDLKAA
jgi:chromosome partitioning protein